MSDQLKRRPRGRTVPPQPVRVEAPEGCSIVDEVCATDAQWFKDHPGETVYERPYVPGEFPGDPGPGATVRVEQLSAGIRSRTVLLPPRFVVIEPHQPGKKRR